MIDTLFANRERALASGSLERLGLTSGEYGLVTLHRPANVDSPAALARLISALTKISEELPLILPAHPRAAASLRELITTDHVRLIPPAGYLDFVALEAGARIVLTDSAGVQEETTGLGVPCMTLRDNTERPITVSEGTNILAGRDPARIIEIAQQVLTSPPAPRCPELWDGHAGERIAEVLLTGGSVETRLRPTDLA
jgi:UDP-N-acetylglucosamine 2-epimerase (non-hydrolysing)